MKSVRIGCGAGYSGDRLEPAVDLAERGRLDFLVFECLAERTIALAQQDHGRNPNRGFDPMLADRMRAILPVCRKNGTRIISNMGAANPLAAARETIAIARGLGLVGLRVACVTGDDVLGIVESAHADLAGMENLPARWKENIVSANAYLGAEPIVQALRQGADVVLTGRVADPSLFLAALVHEFSWRDDDWKILGQGTLVGHLLECAGQLTGGYYADPGYKDVPGLARLGFPLAEVTEDGSATFTKLKGTGGLISRNTCSEQLLYEVQNPAAYVTPDVTADFSQVEIEETAADEVRIRGASGRPRPANLKVSLGLRNGFHGERQISYAGTTALARARLAQSILEERLKNSGLCK